MITHAEVRIGDSMAELDDETGVHNPMLVAPHL